MPKLLLPQHDHRRYDDADRCIYCAAADQLSDEHIIPFGLGGRWLFPKASCRTCARITGAYEGVCLRTILGPLRMYFDLPSRRKKERPGKLPLQVKYHAGDAEWSILEVERREYPFLILLPVLPPPDETTGLRPVGERGAKVQRLWIRGASFNHGIHRHLDELAARLGVAAINPTATFSAPEFFHMLAKMAHAFAMAELGEANFEPFLYPILRGDFSESRRFIGGIEVTEPAAADLHQMHILTDPEIPERLVCVRIRLFACLETPTYLVVAGRRSLNWQVQRMLEAAPS